jgi:hypothetical protein
MKKVSRMEVYRLVAEELNAKGYLPFSAREWKSYNVQSIVTRRVNDQVVMEAINRISKQLNQSNEQSISKN